MGFIGTVMVKRFARRYRVAVADRLDFGISPEIEPLLKREEVELIETDLARLSNLHRRIAAGEFHAVVHLAALTHIPTCESYPGLAYSSNVVASLNLIANLSPQCRFVNFSTSSTYEPELKMHSESDSRLVPIDFYGWTKKHVEDLAGYYARQRGLGIINIRPANAAGQGETNPKLIGTILQQIQAGASVVELGNLSPRRDFIHIDDMAWVIQRLVEEWPVAAGSVESFNLGTGYEPISVEELFWKIVGYAGKDIKLRSVGSRQRQAERELLCGDCSKLKAALPDYKPQQVDDWLGDVVREPRLRLSNKLDSLIHSNSQAVLA